MAQNPIDADFLDKEPLDSRNGERHVLALEMIADQLAPIHSDLAEIGSRIGSLAPPDVASARDIDHAAVNRDSQGGDLGQADFRDTPGITRFLVETFAVGPYRYTDLANARAQEQRARREGTAHE